MRYRVGELVDSISKKCDFKTDKIIFLNTGDIEDGKIVNNNCYKISDLPGQAKKKIKNGDILFSEIRPKNKRYALVENIDETNYVVSTKLMVLRNKDSKVLNMKYFYYFLTSPKMLRYLQSEAEARSGTFPQITFKDNIYPITINLPSLAEQNKIVKNIDSIVNKIKNNQKINTNLEKISTEFFHNWLSNTHSDKKKSLDSIANYKNGLAMQKFRPINIKESLPVVKIRELNQGHTDSNSDLCRKDIDESVQINTGDIIFSWSGTLLLDLWAGNEAGLNQHLFKVTSNDYPSWFIYEWTKYYLQEFQLIAKSKATTMGHIKRSNLKESFAIIPDDNEWIKLNNLLGHIFDNKIKIRKQNLILRQIKNQLLAKLLN